MARPRNAPRQDPALESGDPSRVPSSGGDPGSRLAGFGATVGTALFAGAIAAIPAALRVADHAPSCGPMRALALLVTIDLLPMSLGILALRRARIGVSGVSAVGKTAIAIWLVANFGCLVLLGALLRARTHHRALGGVVFALTSGVLAALLALLAMRVAALAAKAPRAFLWLAGAVLVAVAAFVGETVGVRYGSALSLSFTLTERAGWTDGLFFAMAAMIGALSPLGFRRSLALLGPPAAFVVVLLGASSLHTCTSTGDVLGEQAPLFSWILGLLGTR
jgi:hypothetical protein